MNRLEFYLIYSYFKCLSKKNLPKCIYDMEMDIREKSRFDNPMIELVAFEKVGLFSYLVVWKVTGFTRKKQREEELSEVSLI